jgi:serine protease DegS
MLNFFLRSIGLGVATAIVVLLAVPSLRNNIQIIPQNIVESVEGFQDLEISFNDAVRRAAPAVVNIYSRQYTADNRSELKTQGLGSGVIVSDKGYVITNFHVIAKADQIIVALQDGRIAANAQVVGQDQRTDIAILKIEMDALPVIPLNPQYEAKVGDVVLAIGNPYNLGQTTTFGIISATGRSSISSDGLQAFIQTDAAINQGNSGGALVNTRGELVGINTASFQQATNLETYGISFAIPYGLANQIMQKIIADGRVIRGYVGISGESVIGGTFTGAIVVGSVAPGSPADEAGFLPGDILLTMNGNKVNGQASVMDIVTNSRPGTSITFGVLRDKQELELVVVVGESPR